MNKRISSLFLLNLLTSFLAAALIADSASSGSWAALFVCFCEAA